MGRASPELIAQGVLEMTPEESPGVCLRAVWKPLQPRPLVQTGDPIVIDIPNRVIKLDIDDAVLAERRAEMEKMGAKAWKPFGRKRDVSPALRAYAAMTTNAAKGAVRDVSQIEK